VYVVPNFGSGIPSIALPFFLVSYLGDGKGCQRAGSFCCVEWVIYVRSVEGVMCVPNEARLFFVNHLILAD
jgi:hypothetical protein